MVDIRTRYLGMELRSPIVVSASPLSEHLELLARAEQAGAGAIVMRSLFEEQIEHESLDLHELLERWTDSYVEAQSFFPPLPEQKSGTTAYLEMIQAAKRALSIPVIGSLNGVSARGWTRYAAEIEEAGADALELNIYSVAADPTDTAETVEARYAELVAQVRATIRIPLAVKIAPYFSALPAVARRLVEAGADGLVLFNRFVQPDIDLETLSIVPAVRLSTPAELTLPLRWLAILRGIVPVSLGATTGIHRHEDVLKVLLAGADVAMMASALLINGPEHIRQVLTGMEAWLEAHEYESVEQLKGSMAQHSVDDPAQFERSHYMKALTTYSGGIAGTSRRRSGFP